MNNKLQTTETYNVHAVAFAKKFTAYGARVVDIEAAFKILGPRTNPAVLEIGCANGRDAVVCLSHTKDYLGLDISEELIALARAQVPDGRFIVADAEEYAFPKNLDMVLAFASLLHCDRIHIQGILQRLERSLTAGAVVVISLKHSPYKEEVKIDEFGFRTFYYYTPKDIQELLGEKFTTVQETEYEIQKVEWFTSIFKFMGDYVNCSNTVLK